MKKVAIVGVEGSGKTVMLAGLGDLYTYPDEEGYFLAPKNFATAAYVSDKIGRMRKGEWPVATAGDEMQGLDWALKRRKPGVKGRPKTVCEVSFLDFAGEVYRAAYGISGARDASLSDQVEELKRYVCGADDLIVLINLRDVITNGLRDKRVQEAMWITKSILDTAFGDDDGKDAPHAAIVLSQADSYADTINTHGGALGVLEKYLPHVAAEYGWLDVFTASAVDKTRLDDDGNAVPADDFTAKGLSPIMAWICGEKQEHGVGGAESATSGRQKPEEKHDEEGMAKCDVYLNSVEHTSGKIVGLVQKTTGMDRKHVERLLSKLPQKIASGITMAKAEGIRRQYWFVGAAVDVVVTGRSPQALPLQKKKPRKEKQNNNSSSKRSTASNPPSSVASEAAGSGWKIAGYILLGVLGVVLLIWLGFVVVGWVVKHWILSILIFFIICSAFEKSG